MKLAMAFIVLSVLTTIADITVAIRADYKFEREYRSYIDLSLASSTWVDKTTYLDTFIDKVKFGREKGDFASHNALWYKANYLIL